MNNLDNIYKELGDKICLYPFFGAFYQTNNVVPTDQLSMPNSVRPCSIVESPDRHKWDITQETITESRNSPAWINMRKKFIKGEFNDIEDCASCIYNERVGVTSPRQQNNKFWSEKLNLDIVAEVKNIVNDDYHVKDIITLDYYPSNYCNYSCVMCAGGASSQRQAFEVKFLDSKERILLNKPNSDFYSVLDRVEIINFTGGETVLQKQVYDVIDHLISIGRSKDVCITLLTNASSYPHGLLEKFQQFKEVIYNVSIDGIGPVIEYQRRGCDWATVESNSLQLLHHNFIVTVINYVLTGINVFSAMDFVNWCYKNSIGPQTSDDLQKSFLNISPVFRVDYMGQSCLPPELRTIALDRLYQGRDSYKQIGSVLADYYVEIINRIINTIEETTYDPRSLELFVNHIRRENKASRLPLHEVVPEWQPYFT